MLKENDLMERTTKMSKNPDIYLLYEYRDFVRFIHVRYEWSMKDESIEKLNMRARGAIISQNQPELSFERSNYAHGA